MNRTLARAREWRVSPSLSLLVVLAIPLIQLSASPSWMYTSDGIDPWVYHGYFVHLRHHIVTFAGTYYGTRLAWILPGYAAHALFGPLTANFLLRLYIYWTATVSLYFLIQRSYGRRCAVICCLLLSASADFLCAAGWDYVNGAGIAYGLLCVEELAAAAAAQHSRMVSALRAAFAGMAFGAAVHVNMLLMVLAPVLAIVFVARAVKRVYFLALPALGGLGALTGGLGIVNVALGGRFLFFAPSLLAAPGLVKATDYHVNLSLWAERAYWLAIPCAVSLAAVLLLVQMAFRLGSGDGPRPIRIERMVDACSLPLMLVILFSLNAVHSPVLGFPFYASYLLIFTPLTVGALIGRRLDLWPNIGFYGLAAASACVAVWVGADIPSHLPDAIALAYLSVGILQRASPSVLAATLAGGIVLGSLLRGRLVSTLVVAAVTGAVLIHLGDITGPLGPHSTDLRGGALARAMYLDVDRITKELGRQSQDQSLWSWYSYKVGDESPYTAISSTYLWGWTLLGRDLPGFTDFRFDALHVGTYVALMDDHESAVSQAISGLRDRGVAVAPVERLRLAVRPAAFGIALMQVKRIDAAPKVYTSSPSEEAVRPGVELLDYDLDGLLTHTFHSFYGKAIATPPVLPRGVFRVTDIKDHFGTAFQSIAAQGSPSVTAVEVSVVDQASDDRFGGVTMIFQDQDYRTLYWARPPSKGEDHTLVALPAGTRTVRVAFLANDQGYIRFPKSVRLRAFTNK